MSYSRYPLKLIKENDVCAEIGVWKGETSELILKKHPQKLHLIDPYIHQDYIGRKYSIDYGFDMDEMYEMVTDKFKNNENVVLHREKSIDVDFPNEYFDWIYIDGNHSYDEVLADLNHYYPLVKKGGYLCGDDYGWTDVNCSKGPKPAVDYFVENNNLEIEIKGVQYVIQV